MCLGVAKESDLAPGANPVVVPDFILNSLGDMAVLLEESTST